MELTQEVIEMIETADAKALGTCARDEANVVPVSTVRVKDNAVWLMNYFMGQTLHNISENPRVALACWKGLQGIKIQADAAHVTSGSVFEEAKAYVAEVAPIRTLRSLLILTPTAVYDVAPFAEQAGKRLV